jgi:probable phosphoglycerate mutase
VNVRGIGREKLKNRYLLMRHGRSLANEAGLIISEPSAGRDRWGLAADAGKAVLSAVAASALENSTIIYTSPFLRARETAEIAAAAAGTGKPAVTGRLRERYFGVYDGGSDGAYQEVWAQDAADPHNRAGGVESPQAVLDRLLALIQRTEAVHHSASILLVSHGDPLDILLAHFSGYPVSRHRDIRVMDTAEIRPLPD